MLKKQRFKKASLKNHVRLAKIEEQKRIPHVPLIFSEAKLINSAFYKFPNLSTRRIHNFIKFSYFLFHGADQFASERLVRIKLGVISKSIFENIPSLNCNAFRIRCFACNDPILSAFYRVCSRKEREQKLRDK